MSNIVAVAGEKEKVLLGATDIYLADYDPEKDFDLDAMTADETAYFGNTQGGTTVEYTPETYTVEDDKGRVKRTHQTKASATLKTGLLTMDVDSLSRVLSVGTLSQSGGKSRLTLPGGKATMKRKCVVAVYKDDETGEVIKVGMVATNTGALSLAFAKDKETVPEITFTAEPTGGNDVLLIIEESNINYTVVAEPAQNPKTAGYYELVDGEYVLTNDTTVQSTTKTYYTRAQG